MRLALVQLRVGDVRAAFGPLWSGGRRRCTTFRRRARSPRAVCPLPEPPSSRSRPRRPSACPAPPRPLRVSPLAPVDHVGADSAADRITPRSAEQAVGAATAEDRVGAAAAEHESEPPPAAHGDGDLHRGPTEKRSRPPPASEPLKVLKSEVGQWIWKVEICAHGAGGGLIGRVEVIEYWVWVPSRPIEISSACGEPLMLRAAPRPRHRARGRSRPRRRGGVAGRRRDARRGRQRGREAG